MSASNLPREFRRNGRTASGNIQRAMTGGSRGLNGSAVANDEQSPLLRENQSNKKHLWEDERAWVRYPARFWHITWLTLTSNYVNVLLVFVPVGIVMGALGLNPTAVFIINFLAIMPLASLLSFATEELSAKLGETVGGLMNATFGNAVELIVSIVALQRNEIVIVQASMLGSILSNILLVLGSCFVAAGFRNDQAHFSPLLASTLSSLMAVATTSLIIPATLYASLQNSNADAKDAVLFLSRGTSIVMLLLYILYLVFQMRTHGKIFDQERQNDQPEQDQDEEEKEPQILNPVAAGVCLIIITLLVAVCAEYLVNSIDHIVETAHISKTFIGLILLPIVGNAAEHVTAIVVAYKNKMNLAIGVALGSSMQIALFVTPFLVILGWIMGNDMSLQFGVFETVVFFLSVLVVNYLIQDGKSNYLEGAMCLGTYFIIALAFYVYPDDAHDTGSIFRSGV
ncbi:hypothetical protein AMS68_004938 [Peltaster fructicola]|uniref:Vacuolar calcium ion transporter n=1 Tax=Peltaster fructicola TaxID=286661 RepID=A0A6H0XXN0_9PEZI|nr:hypothetical protein AMS68_004938 [Peltaster fructicola]